MNKRFSITRSSIDFIARFDQGSRQATSFGGVMVEKGELPHLVRLASELRAQGTSKEAAERAALYKWGY